MKGTTKNLGQKDALDRFYTTPAVASHIVSHLLDSHPDWASYTFIEPSAGDGAFVAALETDMRIDSTRIIASDIAPADAQDTLCSAPISTMDFLSDEALNSLRDIDKDKTIIIGNPPFGEQALLAVEFVKRALTIARYVAFILPPSFKKESFQKKISGRVVETLELPDTKYRMLGQEIDVPSTLFVFDSTLSFAPFPDYSKKLPFRPVKKDEKPDFGMRRNGGRAGFATRDWQGEKLTPNNGFLYKELDGCPEDICEIINSCEFPERDWSVGPRSLSQKEIALHVYEKLRAMRLLDDISK